MGMRRSFKLKNEAVYTPSTWAEWTKTNSATANATGLEFPVGYSTGVLNTNFKTSTKYGFLYSVVSSTLAASKFYLDGNPYAFNFAYLPQTAGNQKIIKTTLATITLNRLYLSRQDDATGNTIKLKDIRIFELPAGSQIETDFTNLTADQLNQLYPWFYDTLSGGTMGGIGGLK